MDGQLDGHARVGAEVAGFLGAVERPAAARAGGVDAASGVVLQVRATVVDERQHRPVVELHASMPGAAGAAACETGKLDQPGRADPAAIDVEFGIKGGDQRDGRLMVDGSRPERGAEVAGPKGRDGVDAMRVVATRWKR